MKVKVVKIQQKDWDLYVGILPAGVLLHKADIDTWSLSNPEGYQRPMVPARVRLAAQYLQREEGVFPTSVLLSVRSDAHFEAEGSFDGAEQGWLLLTDERPFWIVDGQHRIEGLRRAVEQGDTALEEFHVPVTILVGMDRYHEMRQFYIVNTRQKGVPPDVAERHLLAMREKGGLTPIEELEPQGKRKAQQARAVKVVDVLREQGGPWQDRVVVPGEPKPSRYAVRQHTLVISLVESKVFDHPALKGLDDKDIAGLLNTYWCALTELFPEAFANPAEYSLQRTAGIYSLHMIFPDVFERCREVKDYSKDRMKDILGQVGMSSAFWHLQEGDPRTFGTGMKTLRYLAGYLREQLPKLALVGL